LVEEKGKKHQPTQVLWFGGNGCNLVNKKKVTRPEKLLQQKMDNSITVNAF
jgi:hypothetical protein